MMVPAAGRAPVTVRGRHGRAAVRGRRRRMPLAGALLAVALVAACGGTRTSVAVPPGAIMASAPAPTRDYHVFVASEAVDEVALIRFGPAGAAVERKRVTGINRADPDGPHGVAVAPDGSHYYVTTAHGTPNGILWKYRTDNDELVGRTELGQFPASLQISPDGFYAYVVNFNLHGNMVPSSVSVVSTNEMVEIARLQTCTMPHGSRLNASGTRHYSTCMMDEMLIEIDARGLEVARHFMLTPGGEHGMAGAPGAHGGHGGADGHAAAGGMPRQQAAAAARADGQHEDHGAAGAKCSPTWAVPSPDGTRVFVACNASNDIAEIDVASWTLTRRIAAGDGVYNLDVTNDGRLLIATNKRGRSVSVFDAVTGTELKRIETQRPVVHGIAISDDDRYAFISVEGYGAEPGTVEVIDLRALVRVASVDVGQMAGGIAFWR